MEEESSSHPEPPAATAPGLSHVHVLLRRTLSLKRESPRRRDSTEFLSVVALATAESSVKGQWFQRQNGGQ